MRAQPFSIVRLLKYMPKCLLLLKLALNFEDKLRQAVVIGAFSDLVCHNGIADICLGSRKSGCEALCFRGH